MFFNASWICFTILGEQAFDIELEECWRNDTGLIHVPKVRTPWPGQCQRSVAFPGQAKMGHRAMHLNRASIKVLRMSIFRPNTSKKVGNTEMADSFSWMVGKVSLSCQSST